MPNHFATIPTRSGTKVDLVVYESNGKPFLNIHGNDRRGLDVLDLDETNFRHYWQAIGEVINGRITPNNRAVYNQCPPY